MIYADHAATTKISETAKLAMLSAMEKDWYNPSSLYTPGQQASGTLMDARVRIAHCLGCLPKEIYFTSGGSEADNQAILSAAAIGKRQGKMHIISTAFEHHAVLHTLKKLEKEGFIVDNTHLILKTKESSKEARRKVIEDSGYKVIIYVGDDSNDFIDLGSTSQEKRDKVDELKAEFGKKYFILPNPVYGGFESGLDKNYYKTDYKGRVEIRENQLEGWK